MTRVSRVALMLAVLGAGSCSAESSAEPKPKPAVPSPPVEAVPSPPVEAVPSPPVEAPPRDEPANAEPPPIANSVPLVAEPMLDLMTASQLDVRVVNVIDPGRGSCGVLHIVGAIEVEVLGVGEPRPHLALYISCPSDMQPRGLFDPGTRVHVELHARKQSWPRPASRPREGLPVRYARTIKPLVD